MKFHSVLLLLVLMSYGKKSDAQYYTIPDPVFAQWLNDSLGFCMSGNQLDTTCFALTILPSITIYDSVAYGNLVDLDGVQYFTNIQTLHIANTSLESVPEFNSNISWLLLRNNNLLTVDTLVPTLTSIDFTGNPNLTSVPPLHEGVENYKRGFTPLLPVETTTPSTLQTYRAENCNLTSLPPLGNIYVLYVDNNNLTTLPNFTNQVFSGLYLRNCNIDTLPTLPTSCYTLAISKNPLNAIPTLPANLINFWADSCNISCFPHFPYMTDQGYSFDINGNPISCIPNYIPAMDPFPWLQNFPICDPNNVQGCPSNFGVLGTVAQDYAPNCILNSQDSGLVNIPITLSDNGNTVVSTSTFTSGNYQLFTTQFGAFDVLLDTVNKPYVVTCINPGTSASVNIAATDSTHQTANFLVDCPPLADPGIQSISKEGFVFPSLNHNLFVLAGDLSSYYGLDCNYHGGGQIEVTVNGPIESINIPMSAVPATVVGNTYTYTISDFSQLNFDIWELWAEVEVDTTATIGDSICVSAVLIPDSSDFQFDNNTLDFCYMVSNSYDPNMKEVYPTTVMPGYTDWLNYTIHFQNTGTAPAINIRLEDTLSSLLDISTIEFIGGSHPHQAIASGNKLNIFFNDIWLPDSTSDPQGSKGYFQFRIKPVDSVAAYATIENEVYIYFDFNSPILTNSAVTEFSLHAAIETIEQGSTIALFPNPNNGQFTLQFEDNTERFIAVYSNDGKLAYSGSSSDNFFDLDLSGTVTSGFYILNVQSSQGSESIRFVVQ